MRIRFETTLDDVIAFHRFHYANSPAWRRQVWVLSLLLPAILLCMFALTIAQMVSEAPDGHAVKLVAICFGFPLILLSVGCFFIVRWFMGWSLIRHARRFLAEGSNRAMLGWREMELTGGRLHVHTELFDASLDLRAIDKIVGNDEYTFVYISSVTAYMIPMQLYPEEEYRAFVAELRAAWDNRCVPIPAAGASEPRPVDERIIRR